MLILGIESSCDETAIAIYDGRSNLLLSHKLYTQIKKHSLYGGVVPELASRDHLSKIMFLIKSSLKESGKKISQIDYIAVTVGPGLGGSLLVGASIAYAISYALDIPVIEVNHLEGHLLSAFLSEKNLTFPFLSLIVSGGHTQILEAKAVDNYKLLGETLDDAVGETFDKVGKLFGLLYPAGAKVALLASNCSSSDFYFPRPMIDSNDLNMSFSGLKTSVLYQFNKINKYYDGNIPNHIINSICFAFQEAIIDVLIKKALKASKETNLDKLVIVGGVSANLYLRERLAKLPIKVFFPNLKWCTDNAAMIAYAGFVNLKYAKKSLEFDVIPRWDIFS